MIRALLLWTAAAAVLAGCATVEVPNLPGARRLEQIWAAENRALRSQVAVRTVTATPDQAMRALGQAFGALGMETAETDRAGVLVARRAYAAPGFAGDPQIILAETPRVQQLFGANTSFKGNPAGDVLLAQGVLGAATAAGLQVSVDFRLDAPIRVCPGCIAEAPPAGLRRVYQQFWPAFDAALADIRQQDRVVVPARRAVAAKPPPRSKSKRKGSGWVLPSSGWTPPPKK